MLAGELLKSCMDASIVERIEWGVPALEIGSLVGDKDLARSVKSINSHFSRLCVAHVHMSPTCSSCLPFFAALNYLLFQLSSYLLIFSVPLIPQFTNPQ